MIFDPGLIRRIESSAASVMTATVAAYVAHDARDPARAAAFGDGALIAFGPGRYVNRAIGVSLDDLDDRRLDELEAFYAAAALAPALEVASWAPAPLITRLAGRGYVVAWFRNVYVAALDDHPMPAHPAMTVRQVTAGSLDEWLDVLRRSNAMTSPADARVSDEYARAAHDVAGATDFLADLDGTAVGCGSLVRDGGIGWLGGAATIAEYRQRGVQGALVRHRMAVAHAAGCELAVATAMPAGGSARNLARLGFTLAYCQAVMTRPAR